MGRYIGYDKSISAYRLSVKFHRYANPEGVPASFTLPTDQQFKLEFQPEFGIQLGIPILMGINLGECFITKSVPDPCRSRRFGPNISGKIQRKCQKGQRKYHKNPGYVCSRRYIHISPKTHPIKWVVAISQSYTLRKNAVLEYSNICSTHQNITIQ